jgi:hypothetical protein
MERTITLICVLRLRHGESLEDVLRELQIEDLLDAGKPGHVPDTAAT